MAYIGKQPVVGNFVKLDAITTSATATYNLLNGGVAYFPQSANNCLVSLNGIIQEPTSSGNVGGYTISGSTIVFTSALTTLDVIDFILVLGDTLSIGTPSDGTVGFSKVTSNLITGATAETSIAGGDSVLIYDDSASALRKMTRTNFVSGLGGLTEADQWRITTDLSGDQTITTNLERVDSDGSGYLGTGMTQSSGVFTFPSTGYYLVTAHFRFTSSATDNQQQGSIAVTINNSTYATVAIATVNAYSGSVLGTASTSYLIDVTSTTTHKVRFEVSTIGNQVNGNTSMNQTFFTFLKLGDT